MSPKDVKECPVRMQKVYEPKLQDMQHISKYWEQYQLFSYKIGGIVISDDLRKFLTEFDIGWWCSLIVHFTPQWMWWLHMLHFKSAGRVIAKKGEITLNIEQKYAEIKYLQYLHLPWLTMMEPEDYDWWNQKFFLKEIRNSDSKMQFYKMYAQKFECCCF